MEPENPADSGPSGFGVKEKRAKQVVAAVHLVLDNLNTHFRKTFMDVLGEAAATVLLRRVEFHYTPKHASWLNMAEIEIGIMDRQCTGQRIGNGDLLQAEVQSWQQQRNAEKRGIEWRFTRQDADRKLCRHYVS